MTQHTTADGPTNQSPGPFIVIGDVMVDHLAPLTAPLTIGRDNPTHATRLMGGQAANTAAWLSSVTQPTSAPSSVHLVAAVGSDDAAVFVEKEMGVANVRCWFEHVSDPTGQCFIAVTPDGDRTMFPDPSANLQLTPGHVQQALDAIAHEVADEIAQESVTGHAGHVHLSGYLVARVPECAAVAIRSARQRGWTVSMDTSALILDSRQQESLLELLAGCNVFFANRAELAALAGTAAASDDSSEAVIETFQDNSGFDGIVVVKDGANGAYATQQQTLVHEPAKPATVVDTTGAGDAFVAGFLAVWALHDPDSVIGALRHGTNTAARAVAHMGAGPLPYSPAVTMKKGR